MISVPLVEMPGVTVSALIDETDKPDPQNSPGRMDSITVTADPGVTVEFSVTNPSGQSRDVNVTGPHSQTYAALGAARFRRQSWDWKIRLG